MKESDSDVEYVYDETAQFIASVGANDASLFEDEDSDIYDGYDIQELTKEQLAFCDTYGYSSSRMLIGELNATSDDINLRYNGRNVDHD
ncbi:hypothetical protein Tco_0971254 [Tanacetum coccineum]